MRAIGFTTAFFVVERTAGFVDVFAFTVGRFAAGAVFAVECFAVTFAFDVERFTGAAERRALDEREREDAAEERALRPRAERAARTGLFQPDARSLRNTAGITATPDGPSMTASTAASAMSARTSEITFDGRRAFAA